MSLNIHSRSVCAVVCEVYAVRSYAYTLLCENMCCSVFALRLDAGQKGRFFCCFWGFFAISRQETR